MQAKKTETLKTVTTLLALFALALAAWPALAAEEVVNINDAAAGQLALLPRIGPALAERIVAFRDENGKFSSPDDLMLVRGIGEKTMELLRPFVRTSGETTLASKVSLSRAEEAAGDAGDAEKKDGEG
jgi:competence protein ComEA